MVTKIFFKEDYLNLQDSHTKKAVKNDQGSKRNNINKILPPTERTLTKTQESS